MSCRAILIHSLDNKHTLWFAHYYESNLLHTANQPESQAQQSVPLRDKKWRSMNILQRVQYDFNMRNEHFEQPQHFCEGAFLVHSDELFEKSVFIYWQRIQSFCFTMVLELDCNRLMASHTLSQIAAHLVKENPKDAKEFLLKPEETFSVFESLMPNGQFTCASNSIALLKVLNTSGPLSGNVSSNSASNNSNASGASAFTL